MLVSQIGTLAVVGDRHQRADQWISGGKHVAQSGELLFRAVSFQHQRRIMDRSRRLTMHCLGYSISYTYDALKRLSSATASTWTQSYSYDGFGNLTGKTVPAGSAEPVFPGVNSAKNHLLGATYDLNGNTTAVNTFGLTYGGGEPVGIGQERVVDGDLCVRCGESSRGADFRAGLRQCVFLRAEWDGASAAVQDGASSVKFENGTGSQTLEASLWANTPQQAGAAATYGSETIGQFQFAHPGTVAQAQLNGDTIYLNPALIDPTAFFQNAAIMLHELLHNVTGLTDQDIQSSLGLKIGQPSDNITQKLLKDCF